MTERVVPYHCPYCAEEDLRPLETHGQWLCGSCRRGFAVRFLGLSLPESAGASPRLVPGMPTDPGVLA